MVLKKQLYLIALVVCISLSYSIFLFAEKQNILFLTQEDGFYETLTAIIFLTASFFFLINFLKEKKGNNIFILKTRKNYFYLLLCIMFFLGFGEEISWGQRIFNIETPAEIIELNWQKETNIHNLKIFHKKDKSFWGKFLNVDRLFSIFWLVYCIIVPILEKNSLSFSRWIKKVNLPIVPIWIGLFFMVNYLISKVFELIFFINLGHSIVETKELNIAIIFLIVGLFFLQKNKMIKDKKGFIQT